MHCGLIAIRTPQLAHQVLRLYETYSFSFYALVTLVPPALLTALSTSTPNGGALSDSTAAAVILSTFLPILTLYLTGLLTTITLYRLSPLHPLARFPGPLPCKVTGFWMAYKSRTGMQHRYAKALHERYGDVVRIGMCKSTLTKNPGDVGAPCYVLRRRPRARPA